ncbi:hypothetical protein PLEOSDRAFT_1009219, partial [Pleurotus ostreatus PC15]
MNYIRGAISTISAPYQYYKELPPINPSTLTGAIDVIVVQRASKGGETELACSPFHVRFGKWQVLRPSEKTVTVTVNGKPIPFNMKIGEAGEAFFVFETDDDDVPADLITSPILQPTRPEDDPDVPDVPDVPTDRFGAKPDSDDEEQEEQTKTEIQEPDFLDLNDSGQSRPEGNTAAQSLPSPPPSPSLNPTQVYDDPDAKVDAMLKTLQKDLHLHDVDYITQDDGSPLKDALSLWRQAALQESASRFPPRPISPVSDEEEDEEDSPPDFPEQTPPLTTSPERKHHDRANAITSSQSVKKRRKFVKTLRLTSDQLKSLELKPGPNSITFSLSSTGVVACTARIFVWDYTDLIVVSDIDGTITKSDGLGHVFAMIGRDWTHLGVAKLYTDICRNGYKIMYLTSRAIGQADATRGYLKGIKQNDYQLPEGPVIMSPDRLMASLHRYVIMRKPEVFKMACLRDIRQLFGDNAKNSFYAGFGNRITDALSYRSVNVPSSRIFTIDSSGEVKLELLELAGYKSSYIHMTDLVDQMFPPIHRKWAAEYTDFNYWKVPI